MKNNLRYLIPLFLIFSFSCIHQQVEAQAFVHPGINQTAKDLAYMKQKVVAGEEPWKGAFDRLKAACDTAFEPIAHTHVLRGPYAKPNIGGDDLSKCANMAYNYAIAWYITNDKAYAQKAIQVLNTWSPVLWDLDYNDAKLLAAWTGHWLCNAAEILRYTASGWQQKDIAAFTKMINTVYYPLLRPYYPQANGNWDGAIIHSLIAMAIFTDNRSLFNNAVDHFKHGPVNGSIFKYIYPNGQCQESGRDQGHVQLGIGEFSGAAQVAYTQGVDLFSIADNRIALGYEYTAGFLQGEQPYCYCAISERAKALRDDYEYVYRHYASMGVDIPFTKKAADAVRDKASRSVLTAVRAPRATAAIAKGKPKPSTIGYIAGAGASSGNTSTPTDAITVTPDQSLQQALDNASANNKWVVLKAGLYTIPHTLKIPSGITLTGAGASTIIFLDPASGERETMINAKPDLHDVTIRDLIIEVSNKTDPGTDPNTFRSFKGGYNRAGILFRAEQEGQMQRITFSNLTIRNATYSGVSISGANTININNCDFSENGSNNVPPGPQLVHNLLLAHCSNININGSRLVTSPNGSGIALDHCTTSTISNCEIARNGFYGILLEESKNITIKGNLIEGNDYSGIMAEYLFNGNENISISNNRIQFNKGYGIESYATKNVVNANNKYEGNGNMVAQEKISTEKKMLLGK
ncbi:MAG: alginate lyase family protein [Chitinophagaceae bacterium]